MVRRGVVKNCLSWTIALQEEPMAKLVQTICKTINSTALERAADLGNQSLSLRSNNESWTFILDKRIINLNNSLKL